MFIKLFLLHLIRVSEFIINKAKNQETSPLLKLVSGSNSFNYEIIKQFPAHCLFITIKRHFKVLITTIGIRL
ncbi:MAG: hypothetical protein Kow0098_14470 [Ignavibacteriaceae bacterium]